MPGYWFFLVTWHGHYLYFSVITSRLTLWLLARNFLFLIQPLFQIGNAFSLQNVEGDIKFQTGVIGLALAFPHALSKPLRVYRLPLCWSTDLVSATGMCQSKYSSGMAASLAKAGVNSTGRACGLTESARQGAPPDRECEAAQAVGKSVCQPAGLSGPFPCCCRTCRSAQGSATGSLFRKADGRVKSRKATLTLSSG